MNSEAMPKDTSETDTSREQLAPYCKGVGLDIGFGGSAVVPTALTFDMPQPYTKTGGDKQILRGDCRDLSMFCDDSLDYIYSSHLLEDFTYADLPAIVGEWRRVLKSGGFLITNCPDQQRFLAHCARTGQGLNLAHKEQDFGLPKWNEKVVWTTGPWDVVHEVPFHGPYSWLQVLRKP